MLLLQINLLIKISINIHGENGCQRKRFSQNLHIGKYDFSTFYINSKSIYIRLDFFIN